MIILTTACGSNDMTTAFEVSSSVCNSPSFFSPSRSRRTSDCARWPTSSSRLASMVACTGMDCSEVGSAWCWIASVWRGRITRTSSMNQNSSPPMAKSSAAISNQRWNCATTASASLAGLCTTTAHPASGTGTALKSQSWPSGPGPRLEAMWPCNAWLAPGN